MKNIKFPIQYLMCLLMLTFVACSSNEEEVVPAPSSDSAKFTYTFDAENPNKIFFTAQPDVDTWYTHWDFGDNTAAESLQAEKIFYLKGEYAVRFKIFTEGGTAETIQIISIEEDILGGSLVTNGELDDQSSWNILSISGGAEVTFENGTAVWRGGSWGHVGIYQTMEPEANTTYQIQRCGSDPFDGPLTALSCSNGGGDGTFSFPNEVTAYLVIRSGGANLGDAGVTLDNITVRAL